MKNIFNHKLFVSIFVITIGFLSVFLVHTLDVNSVFNDGNTQKIVLIDPGHGGIDGGAVAKDGTLEKDINLKISKYLKQELESKKIKVFMTRETDDGLYSQENNKTIRQKKVEDLSNRCKMKKETSCDMFVSIHLNMFDQSKYYGAQVWYANNEQSKELAGAIQQNLKDNLDPNNNREIKAAKNSYKILRNSDKTPSVIVECGFLSNPEELKKLKNEQYEKKVASSITKAINNYFCK